jgi:hypothetical protein
MSGELSTHTVAVGQRTRAVSFWTTAEIGNGLDITIRYTSKQVKRAASVLD